MGDSHPLAPFGQGRIGLLLNFCPQDVIVGWQGARGAMRHGQRGATVRVLPALPPLLDRGLAHAKSFGNFSLGLNAHLKGRNHTFTEVWRVRFHGVKFTRFLSLIKLETALNEVERLFL